MLFLIGSIVLTSYLTLAFKTIERWGVHPLQAIVFNYITCVITGSLFSRHFPINFITVGQPWFPWAVVMGTVFIITFNMVAFTTQKLGVSVATVANKLSLAVPFVFSVMLYREPVGYAKIIGIVLALAAVYFTVKPSGGSMTSAIDKRFYLLPVLLFAGSGLLDTLIKYTEQRFLNGDNNNDFLITAFASAGIVGICILLLLFATGRMQLQGKAVLAGIAIGLPNYFSIWCLVEFLKQHGSNSSAVIPVNNMGIVLFSAVAAWVLFRERLTVVNWFGIGLSVLAIALIAYG